MKTILLMTVYVSSPEKMFMFWGHDGDLFATSVIKRDMGDVKTHFWNLGRPYNGLLCIHINIYYIYCTKMSTSSLNGIKCCKYCVNILGA